MKRGNLLLNEVRKIAELYYDKKLIIYGAGEVGGQYMSAFSCIGCAVAYFVDINKNKVGTQYYGIPVKSPYDLMYEDKNQVIIILGLSDIKSAEKILEDMGFKKDIHYVLCEGITRAKPADGFDPFLGFSWIDDVEGFKIFGNQESGKRIVALGGSTTDFSFSNLKSWPAYFHENLKSRGVENHVYNGGVGGYHSGQELMKLIRDGISLRPDIVISYSGINDLKPGWVNTAHPLISNYLSQALEEGMPSSTRKLYGMEHHISAAENWVCNMRIMHAVCQEFEIKFYAFLQPCALMGNYILQPEENEFIRFRFSQEKLEKIELLYMNAKNLIKKYDYIFDFTDIFDHMSGIYYDFGHCCEEGNEIIAGKIAQVILSEEI